MKKVILSVMLLSACACVETKSIPVEPVAPVVAPVVVAPSPTPAPLVEPVVVAPPVKKAKKVKEVKKVEPVK